MESKNRLLTRKEELINLKKHLRKIVDVLNAEKDPAEIAKAIDNLIATIKDYKKYDNLSETMQSLEDLLDKIKRYDITREELVSKLNELLANVDELIEEEEQKEKNQKLKEFFLLCAEHAEEILKILG